MRQKSLSALFAASRKRKAPIKALLLDQSLIAGCGNIYADEALFLAGVRPGRRAGRVTKRECTRIASALRPDALSMRPMEELYDLESDPGEEENRINDPTLAKVREDLRERLGQWMRETGDFLLGGAVPPPPSEKQALDPPPEAKARNKG